MKTQDFMRAMQMRIDELASAWSFSLHTDLDTGGTGTITLAVTYDQGVDHAPPWRLIGPLIHMSRDTSIEVAGGTVVEEMHFDALHGRIAR